MIAEDDVAPGVAERDGTPAPGKSREQEYEELAESIGPPQRPNWNRTALVAGVILWLGFCPLAWLDGTRSDTDEYSQRFMAQESVGLSMLWGAVLLVWSILVWRAWSKQKKEWEREKNLLKTVAREPWFLQFYQGGRLYDFGPVGGDEEMALRIGRPNPPSWIGVRVTAWCVVVCIPPLLSMPWWPGLFGYPTMTSWQFGIGLLIVALAIASLVAWLVMYVRVARKGEQEDRRQWLLVNAVAQYPGFVRFYETWCTDARETGGRGE